MGFALHGLTTTEDSHQSRTLVVWKTDWSIAILHALTLNILTISLHSDIYIHLPSNIWFQLSASADDGKAGCMNAKTQCGNAGLLTSCHQRVLDFALTAQLKHTAIHSPPSPSSAFTIFANRKPQVPLEGAASQKLLFSSIFAILMRMFPNIQEIFSHWESWSTIFYRFSKHIPSHAAWWTHSKSQSTQSSLPIRTRRLNPNTAKKHSLWSIGTAQYMNRSHFQAVLKPWKWKPCSIFHHAIQLQQRHAS